MAEAEPSKAGKRRVKDPESFRERALKATAAQDKPAKRKPIRRGLTALFGPIGKALAKLFRVQPFKSIAWFFTLIGKIIFPKYIRSSLAELKLVTWPNWYLSRRLTYAVLGFALVFGAAIATTDYGLGKLFKSILLK